MTIEVTDGTKVHTYTVKEPDAITISDYRKLQAIAPGDDLRENLIEAFKALTGIPKTHIRRMRPAAFADAMDRIGDIMGAIAQAKQNADPVPTEFVHQGITYIVPQDIERDTLHGQWEDLHNVLIPQAGESEADIFKAIIAVMCLPQGKEYSGAVATSSLTVMETLPMSMAFTLAAFFFKSSPRFKNDTSHSILRFQTLKMHKLGQGQKSIQSDTPPTVASSEQHA